MMRPATVQYYLDFMRSRGHARTALLQNTRIDADSLDDPAYLIEHQEYRVLLENMLRLDGERGLGLDIGFHGEVSDYGILALSGMSALTLRSGMEHIWSRYGHAFGILSRLQVHAAVKDAVALEIRVPPISAPISRFCVEEALGILVKIGGNLTHRGQTPAVRQLQLAYARPAYGERYRDLLQCPVSFGADSTCMELERDWLDVPLETRNLEINRACREHLERILRLADSMGPTSMRIRDYLLSHARQMPSQEDVAREFHVSPRTLARLLQKDGCSYRHLVGQVRMDLAKDWLRSSHMPPKQIAGHLGFADVAAFRRAFKQWTGQTIGEYCRSAPGNDVSMRPPCMPRGASGTGLRVA